MQQKHKVASSTSLKPHPISDAMKTYGRGAAAGLLFGMPLLMTMEMWWNGFSMPPLRLLLFFAANFGVLLILERYSGFRRDYSFWEEAQDALIAAGLGFVLSAIVLSLFSLLGPGMSLRELLGKIILESIPVSIGVSVAVSQFGERAGRERQEAGFWGHNGITLVGALFFGFNVAPTEEPMLLGLHITSWHALAIVLVSILIVHLMAYALDFKSRTFTSAEAHWLHRLVQHSVVAYVVSLGVAAFCLWVFGSIDGSTGLRAAIHMTVVLGFVTSLGGAAAKLLI